MEGGGRWAQVSCQMWLLPTSLGIYFLRLDDDLTISSIFFCFESVFVKLPLTVIFVPKLVLTINLYGKVISKDTLRYHFDQFLCIRFCRFTCHVDLIFKILFIYPS